MEETQPVQNMSSGGEKASETFSGELSFPARQRRSYLTGLEVAVGSF